MQQPKPVDAYELDLAALGFSSTQMLDDEQPPGKHMPASQAADLVVRPPDVSPSEHMLCSLVLPQVCMLCQGLYTPGKQLKGSTVIWGCSCR